MALHDLLDLVLPAECGSCRAPGATWCLRCDTALRAVGFPGGPRSVRPDPLPAGLPPVHAWGPYAGPLRPTVTAWKDEGRGDLRRVLAPLLAAAMAAAVAATDWPPGPVLVVPAPSSRTSTRRRGEAPLERMLSEAVRQLAAPDRPLPGGRWVLRVASKALGASRDVADQAGLGARRRTENLRGAYVVRPRWAAVVAGRRCLLVDDLMTTGATLAEASGALRRAGATAVVAATIGATQRRRAGAGGASL